MNINKKKLVRIVLLLALAVYAILTTLDGGDFDVFLYAGKKLLNGQNIYAGPFIKGLQYYYSVFFALILAPFSYFVFITELAWVLLSYWFIYRSLRLVESYLGLKDLDRKRYRLWLFCLYLLSFQFMLYNFAMIQVTIFLLWAILEAFNYIEKGKSIKAGILLGLIINIKIMPVLILPYLVYRGYFKAFFTSVLTFVLLLFIPSIFIGWEFNNYLLSEWWQIINPANKEHMFESGNGTNSLVALLPVYLTPTEGEFTFRRNILSLSHAQVETVIRAVRLLLLAISLLYFRSLPLKKEKWTLKSFWEISYFILIISLIMPHQQKYSLIMAMPMVAYILFFFISTWKPRKSPTYSFIFWTFAAAMVFYAPLYGMDVIGRYLFELVQYYRLLGFSTLILIPVSLYCNPRRLTRMKEPAMQDE